MFDFRTLFLFFFSFFCLNVSAQKGTVSAGGDISSSSGSVSYSVGQVAYHMLSQSSGNVMIEGLQVPYEIYIIDGLEENNIDLESAIYPNPSTDKIFLKITNRAIGSLQYYLLDMNGRVLIRNNIQTDLSEINMQSYSNATYILKVTLEGKDLKTFKIIKH